MNKALIIAAHPDDDILGCAGLMSKYRGQVEFKVVFIAEGSSCRFNKEQIHEEDVLNVIKERNSFGVKALKLLGVENYNFHDLPCGRLDQVAIIDINKIIEKEIQNFKPDTIFTHSLEDTNNDLVCGHGGHVGASVYRRDPQLWQYILAWESEVILRVGVDSERIFFWR